MRSTLKERYFLVGCLPYSRTGASFALPFFRRNNTSFPLFVQEVDELSGVIKRFVEVADDGVDVLHCSNAYPIMPRCDVIYCFVSDAGEIRSGNLTEMSPYLLSISEALQNKPGVFLQVSELLGDYNAVRKARTLVKNAIDIRSGRASAFSFFNISALHAAMWDVVRNLVDDEGLYKRILQVRSRLGVEYRQDRFEIDLDALDFEDRLKIDKNVLIERLESQFDLSVFAEEYVGPNSDTEREAPFTPSDNNELYREIHCEGRQEDRISILLKGLIENPQAADILFKEYRQDRGKFANWVLENLRDSVAPGDYSTNWRLPTIIAALYKEVFPMNRGYLLLSLSRHFGDRVDACEAIVDILDRTNDAGVQWYRNQILKNLIKSNIRIRDGQGDLFAQSLPTNEQI